MKTLTIPQARIIEQFRRAEALAQLRAESFDREARIARAAHQALVQAHAGTPDGIRVDYDPETRQITIQEEEHPDGS